MPSPGGNWSPRLPASSATSLGERSEASSADCGHARPAESQVWPRPPSGAPTSAYLYRASVRGPRRKVCSSGVGGHGGLRHAARVTSQLPKTTPRPPGEPAEGRAAVTCDGAWETDVLG